MSYIYIGATAAKIAFGGRNAPVIIKDWAGEYQRLMQRVGDRVATAGQPNSTPVAPQQFHQNSPPLCGIYENVILHEEPSCPAGAETHHRSCALRLGGDACTC